MYDYFADFEIFVLDNGIVVYAKQLLEKPWQTFGFVVHTGPKEDLPGFEGTAHFVEHTINQNSKYSDSEVADFFDACGGSVNRGVTKDLSTEFSFFVPAHEPTIAQALEGFGEALFSLKLEKGIEHERGVIVSEFKRSFPTRKDFELKRAKNNAIFPGLWPQRTIGSIGSLESINAITQTQLQQFYDNFYTPENVTVVALGGLSNDRVMRLLCSSPFVVGKRGKKVFSLTPCFDVPPPTENRTVLCLSEHLASDVVAKEMTTALCVNTGILPGVFSEQSVVLATKIIERRLLKKLREELGIVYDVRAKWAYYGVCYELFVECFGFSVDKTEQVEQIIQDELVNFYKDEETLKKLREMFIMRRKIADEDGENVRNGAMRDLAFCRRIVTLQQEIEEFQTIEPNKMRRIAKWLSPDRRRVFIRKP